MNLYEKLVELKSRVEGFYKDTKSFGYKYVSGSQVLDKINPIMTELKLLFLPKSAKHRNWEKHEYSNKNGEPMLDFVVDGDLDYFWINAEKPEERWEINWQYYGAQNDISKAFGSALTYSERYLLLKSLGLPTDEEDPDSRDTSKSARKTPPQPQKKREPIGVQDTKQDDNIEALLKEKNTEFYRYLFKNLILNMPENDLEDEAKKKFVKRILEHHITKTLKLDFDRIEFVKDETEKPISKKVKVPVIEMLGTCNKAIRDELAMLNGESEEI